MVKEIISKHFLVSSLMLRKPTASILWIAGWGSWACRCCCHKRRERLCSRKHDFWSSSTSGEKGFCHNWERKLCRKCFEDCRRNAVWSRILIPVLCNWSTKDDSGVPWLQGRAVNFVQTFEAFSCGVIQRACDSLVAVTSCRRKNHKPKGDV